MDTRDFIKVLPVGAEKPVIILAANKEFYLSQRATVEPVTEDDLAAEFPEEMDRIKQLEEENKRLTEQISDAKKVTRKRRKKSDN